VRRAPAGGYDFPSKRDYRRRVWAAFRDLIKKDRRAGVSVAESHAFLLPSSEGDEIEVALNCGFKEEHLHVCDSNPAIVATLKRRFRRINTYGVKASVAANRMAAKGIELTCANLDFCSQISDAFCEELSEFIGSGVLRPRVGRDKFVSVSCLRGRESQINTQRMISIGSSAFSRSMEVEYARMEAVMESLGIKEAIGDGDIVAFWRSFRSLAPRDRDRVVSIQTIIDLSLGAKREFVSNLARSGSYQSTNRQTMLWSISRLSELPEVLKTRGMIDKVTKAFDEAYPHSRVAAALPPEFGGVY
jgi:hypothetical protein